MNSTPLSIIVILYHSKHLLSELIENITDKINGSDEIIFVDNSKEDLSGFASSSVKILYPVHNIGYGAAINLGVKNAQNAHIVILNPDIKIKYWQLPNAIRSHPYFILSSKPHEWPSMRKFPNITYDFFRFALGNLGWPFGWIRAQYGKVEVNTSEELQTVAWVSGSLIITNKKTLQKLEGFDEGYFLFYEEVDLCKRAFLLDIPSFITPKIAFLSNQGTASSISVNDIKFRSSIQSAQRYHSKYTNPFLNFFYFKTLKLHCKIISTLLHFANRFKSSPKTIAKERQYHIYYTEIK